MALALKGLMFLLISNKMTLFVFSVSSKGETEPERKETRQKVDEDRKHEYLFTNEKNKNVSGWKV